LSRRFVMSILPILSILSKRSQSGLEANVAGYSVLRRASAGEEGFREPRRNQ
jgi:hypothetical protein